jgi:hypothetical protein
LLLALAALALASRPWEQDSAVPGVSVAPGLGAAVDDAIALAPERSIGLAAGRVAPQASAPAVAQSVAAPAPSVQEAAGPVLAVATARPLERAPVTPVSSPPPAAPPSLPPTPASPPQAAPELAAVPQPAPAAPPTRPGPGAPPPPGTAVPGAPVPEAPCEGDDYTVTIGISGDPEEEGVEELPVEILVQHLEDDGTVSELHLEGDLSDAQALVELLVAEGNCVEVVFDAGDGAGAPAGTPPSG